MSIVGKAIMLLLRVEAVAVPTQSGTLTYTGEALEPTFSGYSTTQLTIGGDTSATNAGEYVATFTPKDGYEWEDGGTDTRNVPWTISKAILTIPTSYGSYTYTGNQQTLNFNNFQSASMVKSGTFQAINAGNYTATISLVSASNYEWSDGTTAPKSYPWAIAKAALPTPSISPTSMTLNDNGASKTITVNRAGDGVVSAVSSNTTAATVSVSGTIVTVTRNVSGGTTVSISIAAGTNYLAYNGTLTCAVTVEAHVPKVVYVGLAPALALAATRLAGASNNSYAIFAGGQSNASDETTAISTVTAYNSSLEKTAPSTLTAAATGIAGTKVGNYAIFAGAGICNAYNGTLTKSTAEGLPDTISVAAASVGDYAIFGAGYYSTAESNIVYCAYNGSLTRNVLETSGVQYRFFAGASNSGYALFGGGTTGYPTNGSYYYDTVYAYSNALEKMSVSALSVARCSMAGASTSQHAIFGGGIRKATGYNWWYSLNTVDAYDASLTRTSTHLSLDRYILGGASVSTNALFAGGRKYERDSSTTSADQIVNTVDAFDEALTISAPTGLSVARKDLAGATIGNYMLFAGGSPTENSTSAVVNVYTVE